MDPWESLEAIPGLIAVPAVWRRRMGQYFSAFTALCLQTTTQRGEWLPCPRECGCDHLVQRQPDGSLLANCTCDPPACPPFPATDADITGVEVSWPRLTRAIA